MAAAPTRSIPTACHGRAETQAVYRLLDTDGIDAWSILDLPIRCTEQRMRACPIVLCLQDGPRYLLGDSAADIDTGR